MVRQQFGLSFSRLGKLCLKHLGNALMVVPVLFSND